MLRHGVRNNLLQYVAISRENEELFIPQNIASVPSIDTACALNVSSALFLAAEKHVVQAQVGGRSYQESDR